MRCKCLIIILLVFLLGGVNAVQAQTLYAKVLSESNQPISNATIYIPELKSGFVTSDDGNFQINLKKGKYQLEVRYLGYITSQQTVNVFEKDINISIVLKQNPIILKEVIVNPTGEDPAYSIMRKVISKAPYYRYAAESHHSKRYIRGSVFIEKLPALMNVVIKKENKKKLEGMTAVVEAEVQSSFTLPDNIVDTIIAYNSSVPSQIDSKAMATGTFPDIYADEFRACISPVGRDAFRYYKFKLENTFVHNGITISKITLTPKRKTSDLFTGELYISENDYSVFSIDVTATDFGEVDSYKIDYEEIAPAVYLPINMVTETKIDGFGLKFQAKYLMSVTYSDVVRNEKLIKSSVSETKATKTEPILTKRQQQAIDKIEKISQKEKISNLDALRLANYSRILSEPKEITEKNSSLLIEEKKRTELSVDSLADLRDSIYWSSIRTIPLSAEETESFVRNDSLLKMDNVKNIDGNTIAITTGNDSSDGSKWLFNTLAGGKVKLGKNVTFNYDGLVRGLVREYNFADGFWLGQGIGLNIKNDSNSRNLNISPSAYFTTARKQVVWDVTTTFNYFPMRNGMMRLSVGESSNDIQNIFGTSRAINSLSSFLFGKNVIRFYERKYVNFINSVDIANGLRLDVGVNMEARQLLENKTSFNLFNNDPQPNYPNLNYKQSFPGHGSTVFNVGMEYTPFYKYKINKGRKEYVSSKFPTLRVDYKKAVPFIDTENFSDFDQLSVTLKQELNLTRYDRFNYKVEIGGFLTDKKLYAPDYFYATVNALFFTNRSFDYSINLLQNYTHSSDRWMVVDLNWNSDYMLLNRIPILQSLSLDESVHHHFFFKPGQIGYAEIAYSIGFSDLFRVGVVYAYSDVKFRGFGFIVSLNIF